MLLLENSSEFEKMQSIIFQTSHSEPLRVEKTTFQLPYANSPITLFAMEWEAYYMVMITQYDDINTLLIVSTPSIPISDGVLSCDIETSMMNVRFVLGDRDDVIADVFARQIYQKILTELSSGNNGYMVPKSLVFSFGLKEDLVQSKTTLQTVLASLDSVRVW
jgi:hypothetical protein